MLEISLVNLKSFKETRKAEKQILRSPYTPKLNDVWGPVHSGIIEGCAIPPIRYRPTDEDLSVGGPSKKGEWMGHGASAAGQKSLES